MLPSICPISGASRRVSSVLVPAAGPSSVRVRRPHVSPPVPTQGVTPRRPGLPQPSRPPCWRCTVLLGSQHPHDTAGPPPPPSELHWRRPVPPLRPPRSAHRHRRTPHRQPIHTAHYENRIPIMAGRLLMTKGLRPPLSPPPASLSWQPCLAESAP